MKNKMILIIVIAIIVICSIILGVYKIYSSYLFNEDGTIVDGKAELIEHIKSIQDSDERAKQVNFILEKNLITTEEAKTLY